MKKFAFQFEPILKLRKNQRELCQQLLAEILRRDAELRARRGAVEQERAAQLDEVRRLLGGGRVNIDASTARRFYANNLIGELVLLERNQALLVQQIKVCRQSLIRADQAVQALEKLAEKQRAELEFDQERRAARELEETWQAVHALEPQS